MFCLEIEEAKGQGTFEADWENAPYHRLMFLLLGLPFLFGPWKRDFTDPEAHFLPFQVYYGYNPQLSCPPFCRHICLLTHTFKLFHSPMLNSHKEALERIFFLLPMSNFYLLHEMLEGFPPLYKSHKADFAVVKFYKVMLTLS